MRFHGTWRGSFEGKRLRLYLPGYFRRSGLKQLFLYENDGMAVCAENPIENLPVESLKFFYSVGVDKQGRFMVPAALFEAVFHGERQVLWVGLGDHFVVAPKVAAQ